MKKLKTTSLITTTALLGGSFLPIFAEAADEKAKILPTITVIDSQSNGKYNSLESSLLQYRGTFLETPKTINQVSRQLLDDQNATSMRDALRNVPGIAITAGEGGAQGDNVTIRGFAARSDFFVDGLRDFGQYYRDPFNTENIEVVQGPTSVVFGRGSTGGVIAQNSKQPELKNKKSASFTLGTNNTTRTTADFNSKINDKTALRLNLLAHQNKVAERDQVQNRRFGFAPAISFGLGTNNRLTLSHLYQQEDNIPDYGIPWHKGRPADVNRKNYYGFQDDYLKTDVNISTAKFEHDFSDETTIKNQTRYAHYVRNLRATGPRISGNLTTPLNQLQVSRSMQALDSIETYLGDQFDLATKFETGKIKHDATFGIGISKETSEPTRYNLTPSQATTNALFPSEAETMTAQSNQVRFAQKTRIDSLSAYALDTLHLNQKWDVVLGIRFDNLHATQTGAGRASQSANLHSVSLAHTDNVVSRNASLVYKPSSNGSLYGNYGTSFNPSAEAIALTDANSLSQSMAPEKNEVYELGTKWAFFKKKLMSSLSVFRAKKDNARESNGTSYLATGSQKVDGLQAQLTGQLSDKLQLTAGYSFLDARVVKSTAVGIYKGNRLANVPMHSLTIFGTYKLPSHLEIGGGANYASHRYGSSAVDSATGTQNKAAGYVVFNAMAKYPFTKNIELQLNVNNLFNKNYGDQVYAGHVVPGEGRVFLINSNFKF